MKVRAKKQATVELFIGAYQVELLMNFFKKIIIVQDTSLYCHVMAS